MYEETTREIRVLVEPRYLADRSEPQDGKFVFAYRVRIENGGAVPVTLESRYWRIADALGRVQEVEGPGVVGEQPTLSPGDAFEYTSAAPLTTPSGVMGGRYRMRTAGGETFDVAIPTFSLDSPHENRTLN
ncbi:MAG: Co2+/Mg2+ efflux protein ApaG [Pseudomonadota bacterium]